MSTDTFPLRRIDHVRFFVGNARQSAYFYRNAFGFDVVAYEGLETGVKHEAGYVLRQGHITFVLTSSLRANDPDNMRLIFHGDGVKDVALEVDDVKYSFDRYANGADSAWKADWAWYDKAETPDAQTVVIKAKFPYADLQASLARPLRGGRTGVAARRRLRRGRGSGGGGGTRTLGRQRRCRRLGRQR